MLCWSKLFLCLLDTVCWLNSNIKRHLTVSTCFSIFFLLRDIKRTHFNSSLHCSNILTRVILFLLGWKRFTNLPFTYATRSVLCLYVHQPDEETRVHMVSLMEMTLSPFKWILLVNFCHIWTNAFAFTKTRCVRSIPSASVRLYTLASQKHQMSRTELHGGICQFNGDTLVLFQGAIYFLLLTMEWTKLFVCTTRCCIAQIVRCLLF